MATPGALCETERRTRKADSAELVSHSARKAAKMLAPVADLAEVAEDTAAGCFSLKVRARAS